jgi:hypothetical protein
MKLLVSILLFLFVFPVVACAGDEVSINNMLNSNSTVHLESRVYNIEGPIYIPANTCLIGNSDTKLVVTSFFCSPTVGVINVLNPLNNKISGFEIDGNCISFDSDLASSPGHSHDQEQLIKIIGSSSNFGSNVEVSNMVLRDSFGDGMQARFIDGIIVEGNEIINTQHESIFLTACKNFKILNNKCWGITSGCLRPQNCVNGIVTGNLCLSYFGSNNNGAYEGGNNAMQIADGGSSHGYSAVLSWISTKNIEVYGNVIGTDKLGIILDDVARNPENNVYVHDNEFKTIAELETMGVHVSNFTVDLPPSKEQSKQVFSSIFDLFNSKPFYSQYSGNQSIVLPNPTISTPSNATGTIEYCKLGETYHTLVILPLYGLSQVQYSVNGSVETHTLMIGEDVGSGIKFYNTSIWNGPFNHQLDSLKLYGKVPIENIHVTCITPRGSFTPTFNVTESDTKIVTLDPIVILFFIVVIWFFIMMIFIIRRIL